MDSAVESFDSRLPSRTATMRDIAWLAGFFEGEGSFSPYGHVQISQLNRWALDGIREAFGGRVIEYETNAIRGRIMAFKWYTTGGRGRGITMTLYALLSPRRQLQARRLLKVSRLSDPPLEGVPSVELMRRLVDKTVQ